jgi:galactose mutarotase-like enzyme
VNGGVAITSGALRARIDPFGAELVSLTDEAGREYMTDGDPRWWTGHAPVLFPIVGALNGGRYRLADREYALEKHGFARRSMFAWTQESPGHARFALEDSAETRAVYPFAFGLALDFQAAGNVLAIVATVTNRSRSSMPFSFGFHPAFAWPLPGGAAKEDHRIEFDQPEPGPIRRIGAADPVLLPDAVPTPVEGNMLHPRAELFEADALIWTELNSRACRFGADGGARIDLAFPDCPNLGVWQKPGAPFLAIEPWHGYNDPQGFAGDFRVKPGVVELPAGAARSFRLTITVHPPEPNS